MTTGSKSFFFVILFHSLSFIGYAQIEWVQRVGSNLIDNTEQHAFYDGDIFVCGYFHGSVQIGEFTLNSRGESDIFLYRTKPDGTIVWAKSMGGPIYDGDVGLGIDENGNIYFTGGFIEELYLDNTLILTATSNYWNAFYSKFDENGNLLWIKGILGASAITEVRTWGNIAVEDNGFVLTASYSGNISINGQVIAATPFIDNFLVASFDLEGNLNWSRVKTGIPPNTKIISDDAGFIYITGEFTGTINFDAQSLTAKHPDHSDVFLVKLNSSGQTVWLNGGIKSSNRAENIMPSSLAVDPSGNVYLTGVFKGDVLFAPITLHGNTDPDYSITDSFLVKYDANGQVVFAVKYGDAIDALITAVVSSPHGVFLAGAATNQNQFFYSVLNESEPEESVPVYLEGNGFPRQITIYDDKALFLSGQVTFIEEIFSEGYTDGFLLKVKHCIVPTPATPVSIQGSKTLCPDEVVTYSTNEIEYAEKYTWQIPSFFSPNGSISTDTNTITLKVNSNGIGTISVSAANVCQQSGDIFQTTIQIPESLNTPTIMRLDCDRQLSIDQGTSIEWYKDDLLLTGKDKRILTVTDWGVYKVQISNHCYTVQSEPIEVYPMQENHTFTMPNVITPNGDNKNEVFLIDQSLYASMVTIYNRWGQAIFKSNSYDNSWGGEGASGGVYYYQVENACLTSPYKGIIHVFK